MEIWGIYVMYDKAKGILPPGQYLVGRDIPVGGYILSTIDDSQNSTYVLYKSYKDFMNEENEISYKYFNGDFHISLMAEGTFLEVENANIQYLTEDDVLFYSNQ